MTADDHSAASTDDQDGTEPLSRPQWKAFELSVAAMIELMDPAAVVEHDVTLVGRISRSARQVDVLVSGSIGGQAMSIAIECKRYAKRLGIGKVDEFAGKLLDLGVDRGVLYSANGATGPAVDRAKYAHQPGIVLQEMLGQNPEPPKWSPTLAEFTGFGDCPNDNCYTGDIGWQEWPQPSDETVEAGSCDMCGTWAVRCPTCATKTSLFTSTVGCEGCEREFELLYDRKGSEVERVVVT